MALASTRLANLVPSSAVWQARVDLAAAHRLADRQGFSEGIFTRIPRMRR
jgi:hypothetical protein